MVVPNPPSVNSPDFAAGISSRAFTLVEMLAVMAIVAVIIALAVPVTSSMLRGNDLTTGSQNLVNFFALARQQALTQNRPIEVRFYQYADTSNGGESLTDPATWKFRAMQLFAVPDAGAAAPIGSDASPGPVALDKIQHFPPTFIIDSGETLSSLIGKAAKVQSNGTTSGGAVLTTNPTRELPIVGRNYRSVAFRFYPNGSTSLGAAPSGGWFLTAHQVSVGDKPANVPANFATLQIDPANGSLRQFRP